MPNDLRLLENSLVLSAAIVFLYILSRLLRNKTAPRLRFICWLVIAAGLLLPVRPTLYTVTLPDSMTVNLPVVEVSGQPAEHQRPEAQIPPDNVVRHDIQPDTAPLTVDNDVIPDDYTKPLLTQSTETAPVSSSFLSNAPFLIWVLGASLFLLLCAVR